MARSSHDHLSVHTARNRLRAAAQRLEVNSVVRAKPKTILLGTFAAGALMASFPTAGRLAARSILATLKSELRRKSNLQSPKPSRFNSRSR